MSDRHLIAIGPVGAIDALARKLAADSGLRNIRTSSTMLVAADPGTALLSSDDGAVILVGRLFERSSGNAVEEISDPMARRALNSAGRLILGEYWGGYLLCLAMGEKDHILLRDPSGAIPAYYRSDGELHFYFSDLGMASLAGPTAQSIDATFAAQWLAYPHLRSERTGIGGVKELLGGCYRRTRGKEAKTGLAWTPWRFAAGDRQVEGFDQAALELEQCLLSTIAVAADRPGKPLLQLSGGLDSSIVAAALAASGRAVEALNYFTAEPDGDERRYARAVAQRWGLPLHEHQGDEPRQLHVPEKSLRPGANPALAPLLEALSAQAGRSGAAHLLGGAGGDNLFCFLTSAAPVVDAWTSNGWREAWHCCNDLSRLTGETFWKALRATIRKGLTSRAYWRHCGLFLTSTGAATGMPSHPWLDDVPEGMLKGKREHVESLVSIQHFLDRGVRGLPAQHHPLLNQPLMELCLRIPSWFWLRYGQDRAVARAAMAAHLPGEILSRRTKGRLESIFFRTYGRLLPELRELLLDGALAQNGILDPKAVNSYLDRGSNPGDDHYVRILEMSALELWWRSWRG